MLIKNFFLITIMDKKNLCFILLSLIILVCVLGLVSADTTTTIINATDRIVDLQHTNGSWDWIVTDETGPTENTYRNIAGVTAEILLDAYELTDDENYLDAAEATGDYILSFPISTENRYNAFNILFLYHLSEVNEDTKYSNHADALVDHVLYEKNYWSNHSGNYCSDDSSGCTASELFDALESYRGGNPEIG